MSFMQKAKGENWMKWKKCKNIHENRCWRFSSSFFPVIFCVCDTYVCMWCSMFVRVFTNAFALSLFKKKKSKNSILSTQVLLKMILNYVTVGPDCDWYSEQYWNWISHIWVLEPVPGREIVEIGLLRSKNLQIWAKVQWYWAEFPQIFLATQQIRHMKW